MDGRCIIQVKREKSCYVAFHIPNNESELSKIRISPKMTFFLRIVADVTALWMMDKLMNVTDGQIQL